MPIPGFQSLMRPLLVILAEERPVQVIRDELAEQFELSREELEERLPSGHTRTWVNRVAWALAHLKAPLLPAVGYSVDAPPRWLDARAPRRSPGS